MQDMQDLAEKANGLMAFHLPQCVAAIPSGSGHQSNTAANSNTLLVAGASLGYGGVV
jgi:hypothetical protein